MSSPNTEHWEQAKVVFTEALERSGTERVAYLNSACAQDPALRAEVESLLRSFEVAGSFMETPAVESAAESLVGEEAHLKSGERVGHYEILSTIGEGGMSEVYLARDLVLGRRVALKILPEYLRRDSERLRRFKQEARTASTLNHPNVCVIYEVGETEDQYPFITMEYIEGETLRQRLNEGPVSLDEALEITIQIANALVAAHDSGVIHRDIKPDNVMVRGDGYVKVLDFGLAKLTEHRKGVNSTLATLMIKSQPGMVMGTAAYMSPEQARGVTVDARSDIWSLGVVLYEMASGHTPFVGATPTDVVISIVERDQPAISEYVEDVPAELERIVRKALRKDPDERYQLVKEMAIDLRTLQRELQLDRSLSPDRRQSVPTATSPKRSLSGKQRGIDTGKINATRLTTLFPPTSSRRWLPVFGVIALLAVLVGGSYALYKSFSGRETKTSLPFQQIDVTKLTINGSALYAAISGDGKYVAYIKSEGGKVSLWLRQVGNAGNIEVVPPREGNYGGLIFSPDGEFIYYAYGETPNEMTIFRVPTLGTGATAVKVTLEDGPGSLSHDGKRIAYLRFDQDQKADLLKIANADGSNERIVATRKWPKKFSYDFVTRPAWTRDDKALAIPILNGDTNGYSIAIVEISLADGSENTITLSPQRFEHPYHLTVLPDGGGALFAAKAQGASFSQIWLLGREGTARTLTNDLSDYHDADLSADSSSLVTVQRQVLSNVFVSAKSETSNRSTQITAGVGRYFDLSWAPDGKILYASDASGVADIYELSTDGLSTRQLTSGMKRNYAPSVSPDNRYVVFHSNRSENFQVWRMDRDGNNPIQLTKGSVEANWPKFSADSRWVYYEHFEPGIKGSLWKVPVEGGTPVKVTDTFSTRPTLSPDGKWLAYWHDQDKPNSPWQVEVMSLENGRVVKSFDVAPSVGVRYDTQLCWTSDSKSLTYLDQRAGIENIWAQSIDGGAPKQITNFPESRIFAFDWSRDGRLVASRGVITSDVVLISDATK